MKLINLARRRRAARVLMLALLAWWLRCVLIALYHVRGACAEFYDWGSKLLTSLEDELEDAQREPQRQPAGGYMAGGVSIHMSVVDNMSRPAGDAARAAREAAANLAAKTQRDRA